MSSQTSAFAHYWRTLGSAIVTTVAGLGVTLKYLFSRPVTIEYPDVFPKIPEGARGLHAFEIDRCIRCRLCETICPVDCISIELEGKGKSAEVLKYEIDYRTCLFCNLCCEACPTDCLWMTEDWDLACYRSSDCFVRLEGRDPKEERKKMWPGLKAMLAEEERKKAEKAAEKAAAKRKEAEAEKQGSEVPETGKPSEEKSE